MILVSHPTGNTFVKAVLAVLESNNLLHGFHTTLSFKQSDVFLAHLPESLKRELLRRSFDLPREKIFVHRSWELARLMALKFGIHSLTGRQSGWASIDKIYRQLDKAVADDLLKLGNGDRRNLTGVYAYEDGALETFTAACRLGLKRFYDLPIAYWQLSQQLLKREAERLPEWEPTLIGTSDSPQKLADKTREINLADVVICPSQFVYDSLPEDIRHAKPCVIAPFGSPEPLKAARTRSATSPLRLLFAGSMSQRKGLADLFAAMKLIGSSNVQLVVMGMPVVEMEFYRRIYPGFIYEPSRPHDKVLELMQSCDVLILPSIVEGRALVQQESLSQGLPIVVTKNAGAEDLVIAGETGFLVPISSPDAIAQKIDWFASNRKQLEEMRPACISMAARHSWQSYQAKILETIT